MSGGFYLEAKTVPFLDIIIVGGSSFKKCCTVCMRLSFFEGGFTLLKMSFQKSVVPCAHDISF